MKKLLSSILIFIIIISSFSSCKSNTDPDTPVVSDSPNIYKAESILSPENTQILNIKKFGENEHIVSTYDTTDYSGQIYFNDHPEELAVYDKSFNFVKSIGNDIMELDQSCFRMRSFGVDENQNIYLLIMKKDESGMFSIYGRTLMMYNSEGKYISETEIDAPVYIWDGNIINTVHITNDYYIIESSVGIQICDKTGKTVKELYGTNAPSLYIGDSDFDGRYLYYTCYEEYIPYLKKYNIAEDKEEWSSAFEFGRQINNIHINTAEERIYILIDSIIKSIDYNGNAVKNGLCDLREYNIISTTEIDSTFYRQARNLIVEDEFNIIYLFNNSASSVTEIIKMSEPTETEKLQIFEERNSRKSTTLRMFIPYKDSRITDLVYDYGLANNITIEIEYYTDSLFDFNFADYLQKVSMRMLSGEIEWDIMSTSLIPYYTYAAKGYFYDLGLLDENNAFSDNSIYYTNILNACKIDGKLYFYPMGIDFRTIEANHENISARFSDIPALMRHLIDSDSSDMASLTRANYMSCGNLSEQIISSCINTRYGEIKFERSSFISMLGILKELYDAPVYNESKSLSMFYMGRKENYDIGNTVPAGDFNPLPMQIPGKGNVNMFSVNTGYAIMKDCKYGKEALGLLVYIAENFQNYFSVMRSVVEKELNLIKEQTQMMSDQFRDVDHNARFKVYRERLLEIYESFNYMDYCDTDILILAYDQCQLYLDGTVTIEYAADVIENAVNVLKSEQS